jgi:hypothetical protein
MWHVGWDTTATYRRRAYLSASHAQTIPAERLAAMLAVEERIASPGMRMCVLKATTRNASHIAIPAETRYRRQ